MNKNNLIHLGAICQKKFEMKPHFSILEIPSESANSLTDRRYKVWIPQSIGTMNDLNTPYGQPSEYEIVQLQLFGGSNNFETIWAGYSPRANVLVIQEDERQVPSQPKPLITYGKRQG